MVREDSRLEEFFPNPFSRAGGNLNETSVAELLRRCLTRHTGGNFILAPQVRMTHATTSQADYLAMLLDPKNPFEYHVFEFKASRADLQRELRDPRKLAAFDDDATFLWILLESQKLLDRETRLAIKRRGFGCAYIDGNQIFQTHRPLPPKSFAHWYLLRENARRRALGQHGRASDVDLRAYFVHREWLALEPAVARMLK